MADRINALNGFDQSDIAPDGDRRQVIWDADEQVLHVELREDYGDTTTRHYRLVEVEKQWTEVQA
ncbi:hypothetical protein [Saccharothrix stipae]